MTDIPDAAIAEIAARMFDGDLSRQPQQVQDSVWRDARFALAAAWPHLQRLENSTCTAAEVKVLTAKAGEFGRLLGRKEAFEEALGEIQKEARWQTELLNRDNWSQWEQSLDRLRVVAGCILHLAGPPDATSGRTDPGEPNG